MKLQRISTYFRSDFGFDFLIKKTILDDFWMIFEGLGSSKKGHFGPKWGDFRDFFQSILKKDKDKIDFLKPNFPLKPMTFYVTYFTCDLC